VVPTFEVDYARRVNRTLATLVVLALPLSTGVACQSNPSDGGPAQGNAESLATADQAEAAPVVITSIRLEVTNPSIAPMYRTDREWTLSSASVEGFDALAERLLEQTKINEQVTVAEYIRLAAANDAAGIAKVRAHDPASGPPMVGASSAALSIVTQDHGVFEFPEGVSYSTRAVTELRELVTVSS
jgi:hypothetical protein